MQLRDQGAKRPKAPRGDHRRGGADRRRHADDRHHEVRKVRGVPCKLRGHEEGNGADGVDQDEGTGENERAHKGSLALRGSTSKALRPQPLKRASRQARAVLRPCSRARSMKRFLSGEPADSMAWSMSSAAFRAARMPWIS